MSLIFKPTGTLDVSTAATDLPEENGFSGMMTRCKNLRLERNGIAVTRHGSSVIGNSALARAANLIVEQNGDRVSFAGTVAYINETSFATGLADSDWSAIRYNSYNDTEQRVFALNGTDRKKVIPGAGSPAPSATAAEWGITAPAAAPTVAVGAGSGLTGTYGAKYTYCVKSGSVVVTESNPSPAASVSLTNQSCKITYAIPSDSQVTHIRMYRTTAGGSIYYHDTDEAVDGFDPYIDSAVADTSLGSQVETDHDRPPLGTIVIGPLYNGLCFICKDNLLYWCKAKQPEYWPANNFIEVGPKQFPITAAVIFDGQLYLLTKGQIWWIQGTTSGAFNPAPLESLCGAPHQYGATAVKGRGIYHIGPDGIYLYYSGRDKKISYAFETVFPDSGTVNGDTTNGVTGVPADTGTHWLVQYLNKIYFHYGDGSMLITDMDNEKSFYHDYGTALSAPCVDKTNERFLVCDADGQIVQIEDPSVTTDDGTAISWDIQSKDYTLQTRAHFPRWVKYDVDVSGASGVTGSLLLDDAVHQEHSLTTSRSTERRLVKTGNGSRVALRLAGSGVASIYAIESE